MFDRHRFFLHKTPPELLVYSVSNAPSTIDSSTRLKAFLLLKPVGWWWWFEYCWSALLCLLKFHSAAVKSVACFAATFHPCKNDRIAPQHHTGEFFWVVDFVCLASYGQTPKLLFFSRSEEFFLRWRQAAAVASHSHPNTTYHLLHLIFNLTLISYKVSPRRQSDFLLERR